MTIKETKVRLKDRSVCILRSPQEKDAEKVIGFLIDTAKESTFLLRTPEEVNTCVERERKVLRWMNRSDKELIILAEKNREIVGIIMIGAIGLKEKIQHRSSLTIAVKEDYKGRGIGGKLMDKALEIIKNSIFQFTELEVVSRNIPAINLYKKKQFKIIGKRPCAVKYKDGTYDDCLIMYRKL